MSDDYKVNGKEYSLMSPANNRILNKLVDNEVYCNMTQEIEFIIAALIEGADNSNAPFDVNDYDAAIENGMDPRDYFEYVREPNILSMSFEGTLYDILNNHDMFVLQDLFSKYGLYYELGNAWNLSAYPINE